MFSGWICPVSTGETMFRDDFVPSRVGATVHGRPQCRNCGMMFDNIYGGHKACNYDYGDDYGGHPAPAGPTLPNLINAVSMLKSKH